MSAKIQLILAGLFAAVALLAWLIFLRPVPVLVSKGTITNKTHKPEGTYWQTPAGIDRGFRTANPIPIAECYVFELDLDRWTEPAYMSLNVLAAEEFEVGQSVQVSYQIRGIAPFWRRIYLLEMTGSRMQMETDR